MIHITTKKIAGLTPRWARFPGFSLLFNASQSSLRQENGLDTLACDISSDLSLLLYTSAANALNQLNMDRLLETYGFCSLPFESYHVTAFDVANIADIGRCHSGARDSLQDSFDTLPDIRAFEAEFLVPAATSELATKSWSLEFGYGGLRQWGSAVAIELSPLEEPKYLEFLESRASLSRSYGESYGVGASESYTPHLSLGYFLNQEGRDLAQSQIAEWDGLLSKTIGQTTLTLTSTSLYGFSDMATFFRKSIPDDPA
jgi:hypothetical protein